MKRIKLNGLKAQNKYTIVDDEDYERFCDRKWRYGKNGYAVRSTHLGKERKPVSYLLHREVINAPKGWQVDHINGDRLDNRKSNLRICSSQQNTMNQKKFWGKSKYKGVSIGSHGKNYRATITHNYKYIHIGTFKNERHAAMAYDIAARELFGEFAHLNFPNANMGIIHEQ